MKIYRESSGFALPTILIASVVMLIVLLSAIQTVAVTKLSVSDAYYNQLAIEAAESGLMHAAACIRVETNINYNANWLGSADGRLDTGDNCNGVAIGGAIRTVISQTNPQRLESSYQVDPPINNTDNPMTLTATGTVRLLKKSDGSEWRSYTATRRMSLSRGIKSTQQIVSGWAISCGVFDHQAWCWGDNSSGQLGINSTTDILQPVRMHRLAGALLGKQDVKVAAGNGVVCVLTADSKVYCAGRNSDYQMGVGSTNLLYESRVPVAVDLSGVSAVDRDSLTDIVAGRGFFCVLGGGNVYCWGRNAFGSLGDGGTGARSMPGPAVSGIGTASSRPVSKIATSYGSDNVCAIAGTSPRAYCWGRNTRGQLGDGTTTTRSTAVAVNTSSMGGNVVDIATGGGSNTIGGIWGYGNNDCSGFLDFSDNPSPGNCIWPLGQTAYIRGTSCAVVGAGQTNNVWCWGANQFGQLGNTNNPTKGSATPYYASANPVRALGSLTTRSAVSLSASHGTMCALSNESTPAVYCWGHNLEGTLGRGNSSDVVSDPRPSTVLVEAGILSGKKITQIGGGVNRQCAIADDRTYCWGSNNYGQIGDGTTTARRKPTESSVLRQFHERPTTY